MTSISATTSHREPHPVVAPGRGAAKTPISLAADDAQALPSRPAPVDPSATFGPRIDFVELRTRWRGAAEFATALDLDAHRDQAFDSLSLTLPAGSITVLLGTRGAGKTLLACHLLGVVAPDGGQVLVDGQSVWQMPQPQRGELRESFGVFRGGIRIRESALVDSLSVFDNLLAQLRRRGHTDHLEPIARDYLVDFALTGQATTLAGALDPASRRRLALALALVGDPPVVVIDDPGLALDRHHLEHVVNAIKRWHARTHSTMLITVRSLSVAKALGQRVGVLRDGRVIAHGSPERVLAGVVDEESFARRFGTDLGGVGEADPERGRHGLRQIYRTENRRHTALVLAFFLTVIVTAAILLSGLLTNPLIPV
jgi:ABC-type multidrug transport system ATPase subunit